MNRKKYLIKNIGLLTIGQFGSKLLNFLLVPFYTSLLTTSDYGTFDLYNSTIMLLIPILTIGIESSVLRFAMDPAINKKDVFSIALKYFVFSNIIMLGFLIINRLFNLFSILRNNEILFFLLFIVINLNGLVSNFARGLENVKCIAISGVICTFSIAILNILFLIPLRMGLKGYLLSYIIGISIQLAYLIINNKMWKYISINTNKNTKQQMLSYSKPLIFNEISWWVNSVSDRYVITWLLGIAENGIYSVGYKIPSILTMFQGIFTQAWTLSAIKDFESEDSCDYFSTVYEIYNYLMVICCSGIILVTRILAKFLFAKDFYRAWEYVPFLLISVIFGAMAGYIGAIFSALKKSKIFAQSSIWGAIVNIILNIILIKFIGAIGAAIATLISYFVIWLIRFISIKKIISLKINILRDIISYIILVLQGTVLVLFDNFIIVYSLQLLFLIVLLLIYKESLKKLLIKIFKREK